RNLDFPLIEVHSTKVYLLNATESDHLNARIRVPDGSRDYHLITMDRFLNPAPGVIKVSATEEGTLDLDIVVDKGGMAILIGDLLRSPLLVKEYSGLRNEN